MVATSYQVFRAVAPWASDLVATSPGRDVSALSVGFSSCNSRYPPPARQLRCIGTRWAPVGCERRLNSSPSSGWVANLSRVFVPVCAMAHRGYLRRICSGVEERRRQVSGQA